MLLEELIFNAETSFIKAAVGLSGHVCICVLFRASERQKWWDVWRHKPGERKAARGMSTFPIYRQKKALSCEHTHDLLSSIKLCVSAHKSLKAADTDALHWRYFAIINVCSLEKECGLRNGCFLRNCLLIWMIFEIKMIMSLRRDVHYDDCIKKCLKMIL